jgi:riboflavin biosynthesis pyrimidine reductase
VIAGRRDWRLLLSNDADFDRVDAERAASDAILAGANTIRRDNPRLLVQSHPRKPGPPPPVPAPTTVDQSCCATAPSCRRPADRIPSSRPARSWLVTAR